MTDEARAREALSVPKGHTGKDWPVCSGPHWCGDCEALIRQVAAAFAAVRAAERAKVSFPPSTALRFVRCRRRRTVGNVYDYNYWECANCGYHPGGSDGPPQVECLNCGRSLYTDAFNEAVTLICVIPTKIGFEFQMVADLEEYRKRLTTAAAHAAGVREGLEKAAEVPRQWANSKSCDHHENNPCCHVRMAKELLERIERLAQEKS